jgi:hypothetical protein
MNNLMSRLVEAPAQENPEMYLKYSHFFMNTGATGQFTGSGEALPACPAGCQRSYRLRQQAPAYIHQTDDTH